MKTRIDYDWLTVRLGNILRNMNIFHEEDVLSVIIPDKGARVYTYGYMGATVSTRAREEFVEFQTEMRMKYI